MLTSLQDASAKAVQAFTGVSATGNYLQLRDGRFLDDRWVGGRWDLSKFAAANGETDWDAVSGRAARLAHSLPLRIQCAGALIDKDQNLLLKASHVTAVVRWCLLCQAAAVCVFSCLLAYC
jgi:hypothetical protein